MPEICVSSDEELSDDAFEYVIVFFIVLDLLGIFVLAVLIVLETRTKLHYHRIKDRPAKLVLTREYLEKLRPPRKPQPVNTMPSLDSKQFESAAKKPEESKKAEEPPKDSPKETKTPEEPPKQSPKKTNTPEEPPKEAMKENKP